MHTDLGYFFNLPALVFVIAGSLTATYFVYGGAFLSWLKSIGCMFLGLSNSAKATNYQQISVFCGKSALIFGAIGSLLGLIGILSNVDDLAMLGPALATTLFSCLYALLMFGFCKMMLVAEQQLEVKGVTETPSG